MIDRLIDLRIDEGIKSVSGSCSIRNHFAVLIDKNIFAIFLFSRENMRAAPNCRKKGGRVSMQICHLAGLGLHRRIDQSSCRIAPQNGSHCFLSLRSARFFRRAVIFGEPVRRTSRLAHIYLSIQSTSPAHHVGFQHFSPNGLAIQLVCLCYTLSRRVFFPLFRVVLPYTAQAENCDGTTSA